jgi:hypothetical protein
VIFLYKFFQKYNVYIQSLLAILLIIFFFNFVSKKELLINLKNIAYYQLIPVLVALLFLPILITYRWFLIVKFEVQENFIQFYNNIIQGYVIGSITMFSFAIDVLKFIYIQKYISKKKSFYLVVLDKILYIYFKIIFLLSFLIFLFFLKVDLYPNKFNIIIIFLILFLLFLPFFLKKLLKKFNYEFLNILKYKNFIIDSLEIIKKNYMKLLITNFTIQLITVISYFAISGIVGIQGEKMLVAFMSPIIETITQLQFLSFGFRELVSIGLLKFINISVEQALLISLFFTVLTTLVTIFSNIYCIIRKIK